MEIVKGPVVPSSPDQFIIDLVKLQEMINQAAERGAEAALRKVGLNDEKAGEDIRNLRDLLGSFRLVKTEVIKKTVQVFTTAILVLLGVALWPNISKYLK